MNVRRRLAIVVASSCVMIALGAATLVRVTSLPTLTVFDVGQGDAILVSVGSIQALIDGGPGRAVMPRLGTAMPFFDRRIEYVILTHPHADHAGGLAAVLDRYGVGAVLTTGARSGSAEFLEFEAAAARSGAAIVRFAAGDRVELGRGARLEALWPPDGSSTDDPNDGSIVLRFAVGGADRAAALLTGDATSEVEDRLLALGAPLRASLLKIGHHGSRTSTAPAFLDAVAPDAAVISVGKNRYGHPSPSMLLRLGARGIPVLRTDRDGDVRAVFGKDGMRLYVRGLVGWKRAP